jgi:hypothetical protein
MLALTTFQARNLLIDRAFLGLSTITSDRSPPPPGNTKVHFFAGNPWETARGRLPSGLGLRRPFSEAVVPAIFLATVLPTYLPTCSLLGPSVSTRDPEDAARLRLLRAESIG